MRILLTNDDGAESPGILLLADALRGGGHRVFMVAPSADASAVSHSITFFKGSRKFAEIGRDSYAFDGTPVDCVVVALKGAIPELDAEAGGEPPDAVVSGINRGANLGTDIVFSGTAAAARQGAFYGVPSLALSLAGGGTWHWEMAVAFAAERLGEMLARWKPDSFVNVNIPNRSEKPLGLARAFPSLRLYRDRVSLRREPGGDAFCDPMLEEIGARPEPGSDWNAVAENSASLSEIFIYPALLEDINLRC